MFICARERERKRVRCNIIISMSFPERYENHKILLFIKKNISSILRIIALVPGMQINFPPASIFTVVTIGENVSSMRWQASAIMSVTADPSFEYYAAIGLTWLHDKFAFSIGRRQCDTDMHTYPHIPYTHIPLE